MNGVDKREIGQIRCGLRTEAGVEVVEAGRQILTRSWERHHENIVLLPQAQAIATNFEQLAVGAWMIALGAWRDHAC